MFRELFIGLAKELDLQSPDKLLDNYESDTENSLKKEEL